MSQELTIEEERALFYGALSGYGAVEDYSTKPQLSRGQSGPAVKELQELLLAKGYDLGIWGADGKYEGATETVVKQFQTNAGLPVTGVANTATWQVLLGQTATKREKTLSVLDDIIKGFGVGAQTFAPLFSPQGVVPATQTQTQQSSAPPAPGTPWGTIALVGGGIVVLGLLIWGGSKLVGGGE